MKNSAFVICMVAALFCSCEGIIGGIYEQPEELPTYGFIKSEGNSGTIYIDATDYTRWTYIDLKRKRIDSSNILKGENPPMEWDFAIHRYDVRTNNGSASETDYTSLEQLETEGIPSNSIFTSDTLSRIVLDMSGMMDGIIVYDTCLVNKVLCKWLDVNTSQMPPIYTLSNKPYLLRLSDGTCAALLFSNFCSSSNEKGFLTIQYIYPL